MTVDVYCLPDTNFFHHYHFFTDVDWSRLLEAPVIHVVVTSPVLQELENHKNDRVSRRRRDRSRSVLRRIDELMSTPTPSHKVKFRKGAYLQLHLDTPDIDKYKGRLEPSVMDDRIIAHALCIQEETRQHVVVLTDDVGMRIKARTMGLSVTSPPDELRLSDEATDEEREFRRYREGTPRLDLGFWIKGNRPTAVTYTLSRAVLTDEEITAATRVRADELIKSSRLRGMMRGVKFPAEEREVDTYAANYDAYLRLRNAYLTYVSHIIEIPLAVLNDSHTPAELVTIDVSLEGSWELLMSDPPVVPPDEPSLPRFVARGFTRLTPTPRAAVSSPRFKPGGWEFVHAGLARNRLSRLVNGVKEPLDLLFAYVTSDEDSQLHLQYEMHASNAPKSSSGDLVATVRWADPQRG